MSEKRTNRMVSERGQEGSPKGAEADLSVRWWVLSILFVIVGTIYVAGFWGRAADRLLPAPLNKWSHVYLSDEVRSWWVSHVAVNSSRRMQRAMLECAASFAFGLVVPAVVLRCAGRRLADAGLGLPNRLGCRLVLVSVVLSIPFGLWLLSVYPDLPVRRWIEEGYLYLMLCMVPEHFLISGVFVAMLLPGRRLPQVSVAPLEGSRRVRVLRWLGLAQPGEGRGGSRVVAWFGLTGISLMAIVVSGLLFGMVHVGKSGLELALSFPGGVAVAYVTLRSRSIWPAVISHWAMNVIPYGLVAVLRNA